LYHLKDSIHQINIQEATENVEMNEEMSCSVNVVDTHSSLQREKEKGKGEVGIANNDEVEEDTVDSTQHLLE